jgi:hypothetical protein
MNVLRPHGSSSSTGDETLLVDAVGEVCDSDRDLQQSERMTDQLNWSAAHDLTCAFDVAKQAGYLQLKG